MPDNWSGNNVKFKVDPEISFCFQSIAQLILVSFYVTIQAHFKLIVCHKTAPL